jgi:hypothetical protein
VLGVVARGEDPVPHGHEYESNSLSMRVILPVLASIATMAWVPKDDAIVYRTEVLAIIGALADLVVDVRAIREWLEGDDEAEEDQERS